MSVCLFWFPVGVKVLLEWLPTGMVIMIDEF